jgi:hypothetical protein
MILFLIIIPITILVTLLINELYKKIGLCKINSKEKLIPYSGSTVIAVCIILSLLVLYITKEISFFKFTYFGMSLFCIYAIGFIEDLLSENTTINSFDGTYFMFFANHSGIIKLAVVLSISCFIYYFVNEEYWTLKAILTSFIVDFFSDSNFKESRIIKLYIPTSIMLSFFYLRWTRELNIVSFLVVASYSYFNIKCYSRLGDNGLGLIGFIFSMVLIEAFSTNVVIIITFTAILALINVLFKKNIFFDVITKQLTRKVS